MTVPRIIIEESLNDGQRVVFRGEHFKYLVKVNRGRVDDRFYCMDKSGREFLGEVISIGKDSFDAYVYTIRDAQPPAATLDVCFGLLKGEKNELLIKAGTQIGVTGFSPLIMARTVLKLDSVRREKKTERLRRVAEDTARMSFLSYVPDVRDIVPVNEAVFSAGGMKLLFSEKKDIPLLSGMENSIREQDHIIAVFGPEGGFEEEEHAAFEKHGFIPVSLGDRALKAEFAFMFAVSVLGYLRKGAV